MSPLAETIKRPHDHIGHSPWLTSEQAAEYLSMTVRTLDRYRAASLITAYRIGPREVRYKLEDLDALLVPVTVGGEPHEAA